MDNGSTECHRNVQRRQLHSRNSNHRHRNNSSNRSRRHNRVRFTLQPLRFTLLPFAVHQATSHRPEPPPAVHPATSCQPEPPLHHQLPHNHRYKTLSPHCNTHNMLTTIHTSRICRTSNQCLHHRNSHQRRSISSMACRTQPPPLDRVQPQQTQPQRAPKNQRRHRYRSSNASQRSPNRSASIQLQFCKSVKIEWHRVLRSAWRS